MLVDKTGLDMVWMMCIFAVATFVFFLFAKYAAGMSRQAEWRPLRAAASFMMLNTLFAAVTVISHGVARFGIGDDFDDPCAYAMLGVMGVVAIEILINFVFDFYRPRVEGVEERPAYDSRLLGILVMPTGLLKTVSATLDYQFGFRVSQTWLYRFTEQWIAPLILFDLVTLYLLTSFVVVGPEQQGVLERRGVFQRGAAARLPLQAALADRARLSLPGQRGQDHFPRAYRQGSGKPTSSSGRTSTTRKNSTSWSPGGKPTRISARKSCRSTCWWPPRRFATRSAT